MSRPPAIDIDALLIPISEASPSGKNLFYEPEYAEIEEARRADDDSPQGDIWQRKVKVADWDKVEKICVASLAKKTKDLQIAAWLTESLARKYQFAGMRDGFTLMNRIQDTFWDTYYPEVEDDDLETRHRPFDFLNNDRLIPSLIRSIPITRGFSDQRYSFARYLESRFVTNEGLKSLEAKDNLLAEGKIDAEMFDDAVSQTGRQFYEDLFEELSEAISAFRAFEDSTDSHFGNDAPNLSTIRKTLDEVGRQVETILNRKRESEPDEVPGDEAPAEESSDETSADESSSYDSPAPTSASRPRPARPRSTSGPIADAEDARNRIIEAAAYLRREEPGNPVPFLLVRALRMGELYALPRPLDSSHLEPPSSEARMTLRRLLAEENWGDVLEECEQSLGRPEGRAWLDPHRAALIAMAYGANGADYSGASEASRSFLRSILADFPELNRASFADDTNTASEVTRGWIESEVTIAPAAESAHEPPAYEPPPMPVYEPEPASNGEPDPWDIALEEVRSGRVSEGVQRIRREVARASSGRDRFRRKLQLAELCLMVGNLRVSLPLLEELAKQVDSFRLEEWEDDSLCARVWAALYRCLRGASDTGVPSDRLEQVYNRLCRLDIEQAMELGDAR